MATASTYPRLSELLSAGRVYRHKKGQVLQSTNNRLLLSLVHSGYVIRYQIANDGSKMIQSVYGPGEVFPLTLVFQLAFGSEIYEGPETFYYETLSEAEIYTLPTDDLAKHLKSDPFMYRDLLAVAGSRLQTYVHQLENLSLKNAQLRVAHQLIYFARKYGEAKPGGIKILMPLTHATLAGVLSLTRETVSQCIGDLRKTGLIKTQPNTITVCGLKQLEDFAYA